MKLGQWLGLLLVGTAVYILWQIRSLLLLMFTAVVLATAANRMVKRFQRLGFPRGRSILLTLLLLVVVALVVGSLIVPPFVDQVEQLLIRLPGGIERGITALPSWVDTLIRTVPEGMSQVRDLLALFKETISQGSIDFSRFNWSSLPQQVTPFVRNFFSVFNNALAAALQCLFVLVLALMLLADPKSYRRAFLILSPSFYRRRTDEILSICEHDLIEWCKGIMLSSTCIAIVTGTLLSMIKIDFALAHGLLAGFLNLIPNIGPALSIVFPLSVAIGGPAWKLVAVFVIYLFIQNLESYVITPKIMANQVALLPALTLLAQIFFGTAFGFFGLLLALPLTVVVKVWIQELLVKDILDPWGTEGLGGSLIHESGQLVMCNPSESADRMSADRIVESVIVPEGLAREEGPDQE
jgi:predicted PurR-regulated permease PerM